MLPNIFFITYLLHQIAIIISQKRLAFRLLSISTIYNKRNVV